ncbi:MAG: histidinol dehydrogenase [Betaproteobacteria bacterium]|nr:histidinol dehydrogenase [Betaproteobacteria bacterium]
MMCRIVQIRSEHDWPKLAHLLKGRAGSEESVERKVREILAEVALRGDEAVLEYTRRFDCPDLQLPLRLGEEDITRAAASVDAQDRELIVQAAANIRTFHEAQLERSWFMNRPDGSILGQQITPVDRVGLYVPGGQGGETPLLSSLLMGAIPAQVAGVREIAVLSPPRKDGSLSPYILAVAHLLDIDEIYRVGGAWAIGALSYGTVSIPPVDVIAGPGNIWVTTAKRLVQGRVGIDMIAGPSEILIVADSSADPAWAAADMLSQAEHDELASAICITMESGFADAVLRELERQCNALPRALTARKALENWGAVVLAPDMDVAVALCNKIAPEHLELLVENPWRLLPRIRHAGAVFMGGHSPEAVGDYFAGPNHVLPTLGTARFASALSVHTFCKRTSIIAASPSFVREHADSIARLARLEGLEAHARSAEARREKKEEQKLTSPALP